MKTVTMKLSEISESREVMETKPYPMVVYSAYLVMGLLLVAILWMYFAEIEVVLKGSGFLRPGTGISAVTNKALGRVDEVFLEEGKTFKKGDILYTIEHEDLKATKLLLNDEISKSVRELDNLTKFRKSILSGENLFNPDNMEENPYYYKYIGFAGDRGAVSASVVKLQQDIEGLRLVKASIASGINKFKHENNTYAMKYKEYSLKEEELAATVGDAEKQFRINEVLYNQGVVSKREFDESRIVYEKAENSRDQHRNSFLSSIDATVMETDLQIRKLISGDSAGKSTKVASGMLSLETQAIISIDDQIKQVTANLGSLKEQLVKNNFEIEKCTLRAEIDGTVNVKQRITMGDYLSPGTLIANIIPEASDIYKVHISMPEKEIANVRVGDSVKLHINALPYQEYGALIGKVTKLSSDSVLDEKQGANFFLIEADVKNTPLTSYKGKEADLKVGMSCDARVITKSKRVLSFLLEKLELWD